MVPQEDAVDTLWTGMAPLGRMPGRSPCGDVACGEQPAVHGWGPDTALDEPAGWFLVYSTFRIRWANVRPQHVLFHGDAVPGAGLHEHPVTVTVGM